MPTQPAPPNNGGQGTGYQPGPGRNANGWGPWNNYGQPNAANDPNNPNSSSFNGNWWYQGGGGLVNDPRIGNGALPPGFWGSANTAYTRQAQPNELTSFQMQGLLDGSSPYMQSAIRHANERSASRGLLNSSIAAGNAQRAATDAALPIAQADAAAYQGAAQQNQQYLNQIMEAQIGAGATLGAAGAAAEASKYGADIGLQRQREQLAYSGEQQGLDRSFQDYMLGRGYQFDLGRSNNSYQNQLGLQNNTFANNLDYGMRMGAFNAAVNQGMSAQNFRQQFGLQAMNNPFIMSDPEAMGGFMDFINGDYGSNVANYLDFALQGYY